MIEFKNFSKSYGDFQAVDDISFSVKDGEITGFVGKNGAGKSTSIRSMVDILSPSSGSITINGLDSVKNAKEIKLNMSYMPSEALFYKGVTCRQLFKLASKFPNTSYDQAEELAKYFELNIDKVVSELSLGNRKKVSIILALMKDSRAFILDEPSNGLDPVMKEKLFLKLNERKNNGACIFLSSHNMDEIERFCDRVIFIKDGKITEDLDLRNVEGSKKHLVKYTDSENVHKEYTFEGDINELIAELSGLKIKDLEIRKPSLEEEFFKQY